MGYRPKIRKSRLRNSGRNGVTESITVYPVLSFLLRFLDDL